MEVTGGTPGWDLCDDNSHLSNGLFQELARW